MRKPKSGVGILQSLDVAVQPVFKPQNFAEDLAGFAFRKRTQIFQSGRRVFYFIATVCHRLLIESAVSGESFVGHCLLGFAIELGALARERAFVHAADFFGHSFSNRLPAAAEGSGFDQSVQPLQEGFIHFIH